MAQFVNKGLRHGAKGKVIQLLGVLEAGQIVRDFGVLKSRQFAGSIGSIYEVEDITEDQILGLNRAKWVGSWKDHATVIDWQAKSDEVMREVKHQKVAAEMRRTNVLDEALKDVVVAYKRAHWAERTSIERCILDYLRSKV